MSEPIKTLFGFPVVFSDKPSPLDTISDIHLVDPRDVFVVYEARCRRCGWTCECNGATLKAGIECPRCESLLN